MIKETNSIWFDGELVPWRDAQVHVLTHALHYGSSVFEGIRVYETPDGPRFFRLTDHIRRFFDSAKIYAMPLPADPQTVCAASCQVVRANGLKSAYVRPVAFYGYGSLSLDPTESPVHLAVAAMEWGTLHGNDAIEKGIDTCVSSWQRIAPNTMPVMAKAGGHYLSSQLIHMEARRNGFHEGIALGADGTVAEGSGQNIFVVRDGVVRTPPAAGSLLVGITRDSVIRLLRDQGLEVIETAIARESLYTADEVFMTGTAAEIAPVRSVDRNPVGDGEPGSITRDLQRRFFGLFEGRTEDRHGWLTALPEEGVRSELLQKKAR